MKLTVDLCVVGHAVAYPYGYAPGIGGLAC